jgi:hypothetical protein
MLVATVTQQMHGDRFIRQAFEVERNAYPVRRRTAKVGVELDHEWIKVKSDEQR